MSVNGVEHARDPMTLVETELIVRVQFGTREPFFGLPLWPLVLLGSLGKKIAEGVLGRGALYLSGLEDQEKGGALLH